MLKNAFRFILKSLFVLKIFKVLFYLFGHVEKLLDQKDQVNLKVYDVTACETSNCNIPNISRSKGNHRMKFSQLIEYNMKNTFFLKNNTQNIVEKLFPEPLFEKIKIEHISWINSLKFQQFVFIVCQVQGYQNILKLSSDYSILFHIKSFLKKEKRSGTSFPASFSP